MNSSWADQPKSNKTAVNRAESKVSFDIVHYKQKRTEMILRTSRCLTQGHAFHITLRCNSRQFLISKGLRRDVLLAELKKGPAKVCREAVWALPDG